MSNNIHYQTAQVGAALHKLDLEAKARGHQVIIQEVAMEEGNWHIRAWAKGAEDFDAFYDCLFDIFVKASPTTDMTEIS